MASGKSTPKVTIEFKRNLFTLRAYAVYGKVSNNTPKRVQYYSLWYATIEGFDD